MTWWPSWGTKRCPELPYVVVCCRFVARREEREWSVFVWGKYDDASPYLRKERADRERGALLVVTRTTERSSMCGVCLSEAAA